MSLLNDKEIRKLCLVPTHIWKGHALGSIPRGSILMSKVEDTFYSFGEGSSYGSGYTEEGLRTEGELVTLDHLPSGFEDHMISPFVPEQIRQTNGEKIISYGLSSMGYDIRLDTKFKIFTNVFSDVIDPLDIKETIYQDFEGDYVVIPPNSYVLGYSIEHFNIPKNILGICLGKSTLARLGYIVNVTPLEPGWSGNLVVEIANSTTLPMKLYSGMGIAQLIFLRGDECEISYADRLGKYQNQAGIQTAIV